MEGAAGVPGLGAIMNHRRHDEAIFERETPDRKWLEELRPRRLAAIDWSVSHFASPCER